ncbi:MAG TPA: hypothetical protein VGE07_24175 [Herpetosiphonaceae bacterium]
MVALVLLLAAAGRSVRAQVPGQSWDFETDDLSGWTAAGDVGFVTDAIDPLTDSAMHSVASGRQSLRIGDPEAWGRTGNEYSSIETVVTVPDAEAPVVQFSYAVVADDPTHPEQQKPLFQLEIKDLTTNETLPSSDFKYSSQTNQEWFLGPPSGFASQERWVFIPWKHGQVSLADRAGHRISIRFQVRDCTQGAHAAYGYLDNMFVGAEREQPALPALAKTPLAAGPAGAPSFLQLRRLDLQEAGFWPWCWLPFLLLALLAGWWLLRRRYILADRAVQAASAAQKQRRVADNTDGKGSVRH